jgi:hypothetical protein
LVQIVTQSDNYLQSQAQLKTENGRLKTVNRAPKARARNPLAEAGSEFYINRSRSGRLNRCRPGADADSGRYRSGQTGQTVNLLALRLQWFESTPAHARAVGARFPVVGLPSTVFGSADPSTRQKTENRRRWTEDRKPRANGARLRSPADKLSGESLKFHRIANRRQGPDCVTV